jgi:type I restriction enzyme S subunit
VGVYARVNIKEIFCLLGSVILIKPSSLIDSGYLECALRPPLIFAALVSASGATAQEAIYLRDLKKISLPLPPLAEQHRIAAKVDALMALRDGLEASLTATAARRRLLDAPLAEALAPAEDREMEAAE